MNTLLRAAAIAGLAIASPWGITSSLGEIHVSASDVYDNTYTYELTYQDMLDGVKWTDAVEESRGIALLKEEAGVAYVTPTPDGTEAGFSLEFDFSNAGYRIKSVAIRDRVVYFADAANPGHITVSESYSTDAVKEELVWKMIGSDSSRQMPDSETELKFDGLLPKKFTYKLAFEVNEGDSLGKFHYCGVQWNRLEANSSSDDTFKIVFQLEKK